MLNINGKKYLSEKEMSVKFGLSVHWFRKTRYSGRSPSYYKFNKKIYYSENSAEEWFKQHLILCE